MDVVLTCKGNFNDEYLDQKISFLRSHLSSIINSDCAVLRVEPWNSIKVTFSIPSKAAKQLRELARVNSNLLNELDVLSVQVEGEEVIRLSSDIIGQDAQQPLQPSPSILHQEGMQQQQHHMFSPSGMATGPHSNPHMIQPANPAKRRRKTKEKQPTKSNKANQHKGVMPTKLPVPMPSSTVLPTTDILSQGSPQFSITQLPPGVEEIVTEAWDQELHRQNPEDDIGLMDIQLQSFSSGANVSAGSNQAMMNSSTFDQQAVQIPKHQQHNLPADACNVMHGIQPELQKQQSVPSNFAPGHIPMEQKMFPGQNMGMAANNVNQINQDPAFFNQQINMQGGNQEISQAQQINNIAANYPSNTILQASSAIQFANAAPHMHWQQNSSVQQQSNMFKMQRHNLPANNYPLQQTNQNEMSSHNLAMNAQGNMMMSPGNIMTSQPSMASQIPMTSPGAMMVSHGNINSSQAMVTQNNFMTSQSGMIASQGNMMTSQGTMSPAVMGHHQFPFSFPSPVKQQGANVGADKLQTMGQNMSMDSPLLVDLLQTEANAGAAGMSNPAQFPNVTATGSNQKPKRKKPTRKKKPPKSSSASTPTGTVPMQAFPGMYNMPGQFAPQHYQAGDMQNQDQMMQQPMKMSSHDSKFIDAISRSDVGAQATAFPNDGAIASEVGLHPPTQQMPMLRRHNSFPVPRSASFPHGFDPTKTSPYSHKAHPGMSPQQQMYMGQMPGAHPGFKSAHPPRQMMVQPQQSLQQQQGVTNSNPAQYQATNFQHGNPAMSMIQQQGTRPQLYPVHPLTPPQMRMGGFPQPMSHPGRVMKTPAPLPTLPQQRPVRPQGTQVAHKLSSLVGRLSNGVMSVMLKSSCVASSIERKPPTFPTIPQQRPQSARGRKSPASSFESMSPKMSHPNTPSPKLQHYGMASPMAAPGSGKNAPSQNRPLSRNFAPTTPGLRRPSLEQFGNVLPGHVNRGIGGTPTPPPSVGVNVGGIATPPSTPHFQLANPGPLQQPTVTDFPPRNPQWPNAMPAPNTSQQFYWSGQPSASVANFPTSGNPSSRSEASLPSQATPDKPLLQSATPPAAPTIDASPAPPAATETNEAVKNDDAVTSSAASEAPSSETPVAPASTTEPVVQ